MIHPIGIKRIKAFAIDYLVIAVYIILLAAVAFTLFTILGRDPLSPGYTTNEWIGFFTLTLPVVLYFTLFENRLGATLGKRKLGLRVTDVSGSKASFGPLLMRNILKFLPWEIAHFFLYRLYDFSESEAETPDYDLTGLILALAIAILYLLVMIFSKSHRPLYEWLSATKVIALNPDSAA